MFKEAWKAQNLRRVSFKPKCYHFGSCHVQGHQDKQMVSFGNLLIISRPRPPKWFAGIVSDPRPPQNSPNASSTISLGVVCFRNDPPFEMAFHSEWLRNNPKGPYGPIPPRAPKALGCFRHMFRMCLRMF